VLSNWCFAWCALLEIVRFESDSVLGRSENRGLGVSDWIAFTVQHLLRLWVKVPSLSAKGFRWCHSKTNRNCGRLGSVHLRAVPARAEWIIVNHDPQWKQRICCRERPSCPRALIIHWFEICPDYQRSIFCWNQIHI
jgi:hypothetical protein